MARLSRVVRIELREGCLRARRMGVAVATERDPPMSAAVATGRDPPMYAAVATERVSPNVSPRHPPLHKATEDKEDYVKNRTDLR